MKVKLVSLYNKLTLYKVKEYSRFKIGYIDTTDFLTKKMTELILKNLSVDKKYVLYTTNRFPTKSYYKKNSLLLTEKIAKNLHLPLIVGQYKYRYNKKTFYDHYHRKIHLPKVSRQEKVRFKNYIFLMIDDSVLTKTTLKVSLNELKNVTNELIFFSVINLKNSKYTETQINDYYYKKHGLVCLIELLKTNKYIITTHFLRIIDVLNKSELIKLSKGISQKQKKLLIKAFKKYIGKDLDI